MSHPRKAPSGIQTRGGSESGNDRAADDEAGGTPWPDGKSGDLAGRRQVGKRGDLCLTRGLLTCRPGAQVDIPQRAVSAGITHDQLNIIAFQDALGIWVITFAHRAPLL